MLTFTDEVTKRAAIASMRDRITAHQLEYGMDGCYRAEFDWRWGIPAPIARLHIVLSEFLPQTDAVAWSIEFLEAIPERADLSMVWPGFMLHLLSDPDSPVMRCAKPEDQSTIDRTSALLRTWVQTGRKPDKDYWLAVVRSATRLEREFSVASLVASAASLPDGWSSEAMELAARSAVVDADHTGKAKWMRDLLLRLLRQAPVFPNPARVSSDI